MVRGREKNKRKAPAKQGSETTHCEPNKIRASTRYDFEGKNLTPYGGLLPVATMLEKLGFQELVESTMTSKRITRALNLYKFVLGLVLGFYVGLQRLNQMRFIAHDPVLTGILGVDALPGQSTLWRFLAGLHLNVPGQILKIQQTLRQRVWEAANVKLDSVTLDTDTTVHTVYGKQMGARKGYNPKNKGKLSYQPILTFMAETREYIYGDLHSGDRHSGKEIAAHIDKVMGSLPASVRTIYARVDSGFYCWEAVEAYEKWDCQFIACARKTTGWSSNWRRQSGSRRRKPMPMSNANLSTSRTVGARRTVLWLCAMTRRDGRRRRKARRTRNVTPMRPNNTNCSTRLPMSIACS